MSFPKWVEEIFQAEQDRLEEGTVIDFEEIDEPDIDPRYLILLGDDEEEEDDILKINK